jgi:hypothetical protein
MDTPPEAFAFHSITMIEPFKVLSLEQFHWLEYEATIQGHPGIPKVLKVFFFKMRILASF